MEAAGRVRRECEGICIAWLWPAATPPPLKLAVVFGRSILLSFGERSLLFLVLWETTEAAVRDVRDRDRERERDRPVS